MRILIIYSKIFLRDLFFIWQARERENPCAKAWKSHIIIISSKYIINYLFRQIQARYCLFWVCEGYGSCHNISSGIQSSFRTCHVITIYLFFHIEFANVFQRETEKWLFIFIWLQLMLVAADRWVLHVTLNWKPNSKLNFYKPLFLLLWNFWESGLLFHFLLQLAVT